MFAMNQLPEQLILADAGELAYLLIRCSCFHFPFPPKQAVLCLLISKTFLEILELI